MNGAKLIYAIIVLIGDIEGLFSTLLYFVADLVDIIGSINYR